MTLLISFFFFLSLALPLFADQTVTVTGTVAAQPTAFQLAISSSPPSSTTVSQFQTITYTVTYGSHLYYATPMTIVASWTQGTIQGQGSPSVDIADYVLNSASNGYGSTAPVVDVTNKTITWTINSFPSQTTDQTITFLLKTNASYTGANPVTFTTNIHMSDSNVSIPDQSTDTTYQYNPGFTPTPSPTFTPSPTITPQPTITGIAAPTTIPSPTPIPISPDFLFTDITLKQVSATDATISVSTSNPSSLVFFYGLAQNRLNQTITSLSLLKDHDITLSDLQPNTTYYFKIIATDSSGKKITSDYFSFKTAIVSIIPAIDRNNLIITSENIILYNSLLNPNNALRDSIVIPTTTAYNFQLALTNAASIKKLHATITNKNVFRINTFDDISPSPNNITLLQVKSGVYAGRLLSAATPGVYTLSVTVYDTNGNIVPLKIVDVWVENPIRIFSGRTKEPIEKAKIQLSLYDEADRKYVILSPQTLSIKNPDFTNSNGILTTVLPQGKYKATITALFYKPQTIEFTIAPENNSKYPQVYLDTDGFNIITFIHYYLDTGIDFVHDTRRYLQDLSISHRFFDLLVSLTLFFLILITLVSLAFRLRASLFHLPILFIHHLNELLNRRKRQHTMGGKLCNENTGQPVEGALVWLYNAATNKLINKVFTNHFGEFLISNVNCLTIRFLVQKKGYDTHREFEYSLEELMRTSVVLEIKPLATGHTIIHLFLRIIENLFAVSLEWLLMITIVFEVLFAYTFGLYKALPFLIISLFNLLLWLFDTWKPKR